MDIAKLGIAGGIFFIFTFIHFIVDWIPQSHKEAMGKYHFPDVRARHCLMYTLGFVPLLLLFKFSSLELCIGCSILFLSHYIEDSYKPVYLWAKYIRRPSEMVESNDEIGFLRFAETNLGKILVITIDQIIHITFLIPLVIIAVNNIKN